MNASYRLNTCKSRGIAVWQHTGGDRRTGEYRVSDLAFTLG